MIVTLKEILKLAEAKKCAVGSFNTPNLESLNAVIGAAEKENAPVIIMLAQIHEEMKITDLDFFGEVMLMAADRANVPVCVHLDHGTDIAFIKRALDKGFTSVMYDGSLGPIEENYATTSMMVELAARYGASVEAEIGSMGSREGDSSENAGVYTDPKAAVDFAEQTGIDALACAFGTAHGIYLKKPQLDFARLDAIHRSVNVPIVMHGGSGVSNEDYRKVISLGVRKINYYTYMALAGGKAVAELEDKTYFHDIAVEATRAMEENVAAAIRVFSGKE